MQHWRDVAPIQNLCHAVLEQVSNPINNLISLSASMWDINNFSIVSHWQFIHLVFCVICSRPLSIDHLWIVWHIEGFHYTRVITPNCKWSDIMMLTLVLYFHVVSRFLLMIRRRFVLCVSCIFVQIYYFILFWSPAMKTTHHSREHTRIILPIVVSRKVLWMHHKSMFCQRCHDHSIYFILQLIYLAFMFLINDAIVSIH